MEMEAEEEDDDGACLLPLGRRAWEEKKKLWVVAGPSIFTRFSSFGVTVISQAFISATELAAYALVSTVLTRFSNGILGIWIGMLLGTLVQSIVLLFITLKTDWGKQVALAQERLKRWYMDENRRLVDSRGDA